ncbi:hypothetical protein T07_13554 [Trichinella nelsoni]|uniref:Uncharacterized protein n=1 Tax=Trichinella nelsoni TaxID=6336 RepID=A0A0V0RI37_9BILA|nr:hypothetical protein T07_13554 [Trichinella nelsoni]
MQCMGMRHLSNFKKCFDCKQKLMAFVEIFCYEQTDQAVAHGGDKPSSNQWEKSNQATGANKTALKCCVATSPSCCIF